MWTRIRYDDVSNRRNAVHVRPVEVVHDDVTALHGEPDVLRPEPCGDGTASGCDEQVVGLERLRFAVGKLCPESPPRHRSRDAARDRRPESER